MSEYTFTDHVNSQPPLITALRCHLCGAYYREESGNQIEVKDPDTWEYDNTAPCHICQSNQDYDPVSDMRLFNEVKRANLYCESLKMINDILNLKQQ